jgi:hypothetical protein
VAVIVVGVVVGTEMRDARGSGTASADVAEERR